MLNQLIQGMWQINKLLPLIYFSLLSWDLNAQIRTEIDYSNPDNWAALPEKADSADLVPGDMSKDLQDNAPVDVFFLYPTSYTKDMIKGSWNAPIDDILINEDTDSRSIKYQASLFNQVGKIYAPRYRQAHISAYFTKDTMAARQALDFAYQDVKAAFLYYLKHYNRGRPFIIASHSQGTTHAIRLIKEVIENTPLEKQLVVAYLAGMPVFKGFLSIPICDTAVSTGCYCTWRTFRKGYIPEYIKHEQPVAVTNPISWTTHEGMTPLDAHMGAVLFDFEKGIQPHIVQATVAGNVLWIKKPKVHGKARFILTFARNYHAGDYNLYYKDIQENAQLRVKEYLEHLNKTE